MPLTIAVEAEADRRRVFRRRNRIVAWLPRNVVEVLRSSPAFVRAPQKRSPASLPAGRVLDVARRRRIRAAWTALRVRPASRRASTAPLRSIVPVRAASTRDPRAARESPPPGDRFPPDERSAPRPATGHVHRVVLEASIQLRSVRMPAQSAAFRRLRARRGFPSSLLRTTPPCVASGGAREAAPAGRSAGTFRRRRNLPS